jgi:hypothetical protein
MTPFRRQPKSARVAGFVAAVTGPVAVGSFGFLVWLWENTVAFNHPEEDSDPYWWVDPLVIICLASIVVSFVGLLVFFATRKIEGDWDTPPS